MLVSASAAQRRQFFSALIQRASKKRRGLGGGSLTLLLALPGVPASGERTLAGAGGAAVAMANYQHLSPELKAKLAAALAAQAEQQRDAGLRRRQHCEAAVVSWPRDVQARFVPE